MQRRAGGSQGCPHPPAPGGPLVSPMGSSPRAHPSSSSGDGRSADRGLRIALLSYRSKPQCGGQGIYLRHLSRKLVALGHRVEVFSGQPHPELASGITLHKVPSLDLYRTETFRLPHPGEYRDWIGALEVTMM